MPHLSLSVGSGAVSHDSPAAVVKSWLDKLLARTPNPLTQPEASSSFDESMRPKFIQGIGFGITVAYAAFIIWIYATEPRTLREAATDAEVVAGTYQINQEQFNSALALFRREQFRAAREEWERLCLEIFRKHQVSPTRWIHSRTRWVATAIVIITVDCC
jgi:hypothetical protein